MKIVTSDMMTELLSVDTGTCISLYMPTHRTHPDNQKDPIVFKNLVKELEDSLTQQYSPSEVKELLKPFEALEQDDSFWKHTYDGLAVLSTHGTFKTIGLPVTTEQLTVVADSFHTKPLRKYLQSVERFHVLGLSLQDYHIYEGNRHSVTELELPSDTPKNINEALGFELTEPHSTVASYGGGSGGSGAAGLGHGGEMHHGHGGKSAEMDTDAERFFRFVAKTINELYSKPSGLPLILAALPEHHNLFHKVSDIPTLLPEGLDVHPKTIEADELADRAWKIMEPYYNSSIEKSCDFFQQSKANGAGSDNITEVAAAAAAGRVDTLIIEANRQIAGNIKTDTGSIEKGNLENPEMDDLLDDIGELVTKMGGKVIVVPSDKMPTDTGIAGTFRY